MDNAKRDENSQPIVTVEYELSDDVARQLALDLVVLRLVAPPSSRVPALRGLSPVVVLLGAALQIVVAMAVLLLIGGWDWIVTKLLALASVVVIAILLWKAAFYGLPSFARWYACRRAVRHAQGLAHRRIRWRLYEDRLETESASALRRTAWSEVVEMTTAGQSVALRLHAGVELLIPASVLPAETQSIIAARIAPR
jgi:hypothetical protein